MLIKWDNATATEVMPFAGFLAESQNQGSERERYFDGLTSLCFCAYLKISLVSVSVLHIEWKSTWDPLPRFLGPYSAA